MRKNIALDIISVQTKLEGDFFAADGEGEKNKIEISTEGELVIEDGKLRIEYEETELTGMDGALTVLEFSEDDRQTVTMTRSGGVSASMIFKENSRYMTTYETGFFPIEMCIVTKNVNNEMYENGGVIALDYTIEIHGVCMERTYLTVKATEITQ
ncbi:MAG: DUF1934 domain-containing protein [Clostridia bacterium]|nr:DUF1934 domain-containing protein [Clostridia bacterium]